ncbi:MAG: methyltransferase family protein [Vicinamibacterales bacterium]
MPKALSVSAFALMAVGLGFLVQDELRTLLHFRKIGALSMPMAWAVSVQVLAILLMMWARVTFRARSFHLAANPTEGGLVTTGPYRFIRHPIYTAACFIAWPGAILIHTPAAFVAVALVTAGAAARILSEERLVAERYPEYREYARATRRMIPWVW